MKRCAYIHKLIFGIYHSANNHWKYGFKKGIYLAISSVNTNFYLAVVIFFMVFHSKSIAFLMKYMPKRRVSLCFVELWSFQLFPNLHNKHIYIVKKDTANRFASLKVVKRSHLCDDDRNITNSPIIFILIEIYQLFNTSLSLCLSSFHSRSLKLLIEWCP